MRLLLSLLVLAPLSAEAAMMEHYDLASLWQMSDEVILADEVFFPSSAAWSVTRTYQATKVYKGSLKVGDNVEVFNDAYDLNLPRSYSVSAGGEVKTLEPPTPETRVFLFLVAPRRGVSGYQKVPSGMRLIADGRVYRFEQQ